MGRFASGFRIVIAAITGAQRVNDSQDEERIFLAALEIRSAQLRADYVAEACADDNRLHRRVQALLARHDETAGVLDAPPLGINGDGTDAGEKPGTVIGRYTLVEQIGEGGFGVVYLAEQQQPVKRKVALKLIKPGMDTREVIARFEAERQALALMDHPNIAKVFDAGTIGMRNAECGMRSEEEGASAHSELRTPNSALEVIPHSNGRPYFVMELVQGVPITEYCDQCHLSTSERLELFVSVCQAIQHAHQKGIIHRDIKPTNVLVAMLDPRARATMAR